MSKVVLKNVYKYYEKNPNPSVSDFNLEIQDKEFIVFVGPSGCGKSTTLRMVAGLETISEGEVYIGEKLVNDIEPKDRDIAMVFQNYALYPHMTVFKNMAFGLTMAKTPVEVRDKNTIVAKNKSGKPYNCFTALFARTPNELRDEDGKIVYGEAGKPQYETKMNKDGGVKTDKNGNPVYVMRPYTLDELYGKVVLDENGHPVYQPKLYNFFNLLFERVRIEAGTDENGNVIYETVKDKNGEVKLDKHGKPVYKMRALTSEEKAAKKGTPRIDKDGKPVYKLRKYAKQEIKAKVLEAAKILDIEEYLQRKPSQLSGGQRQRVAIGRSIVRKPKVFLMDEPLSNLDAKLRNQMRAEIKLLSKKINTTFIYVTHDQTEAMTLGDRIVIMKLGVVQQIGTPVEVFDHPNNLFVAGFIGSPQMNFFDAKLINKNGSYKVVLEDGEFDLTAEANKKLADAGCPEKEITLGIRPEHVGIKTHKSNPGAAYLKAQVTVSEMMGSELYVHATFGEGQNIVIRIPTITLTQQERDNIDNGGIVEFTLTKEAIHIFDKDTEENLVKYN